MGGRFLVKSRADLRAAPRGTGFGLGGVGFSCEKLFDVPVEGVAGLTAAPPTAASWYLLRTDLPFAAAGTAAEWDMAHRLHRELSTGLGLAPGADIVAVEPDFEQSWLPPEEEILPFSAAPCSSAGQKGAPFAAEDDFAWHLGDKFSGLKQARDAVGERGATVTIAHFDTGYDPDHKVLPRNLDRQRQRNFVEADRPRDATDRAMTGALRNPGHGIGTLGILAGNRLTDTLPESSRTGDFLGGAPLARIVPMRVANSVVHLWTSTVAQAFDEASGLGVDVISMSMGGLPSLAWADAVNKAYEAGIVIVCAAGNNYGKVPTPHIVYPARFDRAIAACGIMADGRPYHNLPLTAMQGNIGPASRMTSALAAYTPNIPWAKIGCRDVIDLDGAGTSAATPQVAAAAALWLARHGQGLARDWRRVELARKALFSSAGKSLPGMGASDFAKYFGNGIVRARKALDLAPSRLGTVRQTPRDSATFPFLRLLTGLGIAPDPVASDLLALEMTQLAQSIGAFREAFEDPDALKSSPPEEAGRRAAEILLEDSRCSSRLRAHLEGIAGRRQPPGPARRKEEAAAETEGERAPMLGSQIPRRLRGVPPPHRKLRILALDPSFSNRLDTAAINEVTVHVPWETDADGKDMLKPGPVGEYLEVVDVDPQSGHAYAPVDLDHPHVLARNGLDPSTGNPKFHQQMVYAVAMKTIGHFERALGRLALWAPRSSQSRPARRRLPLDWDFVRRLRIHPHALRQANAYYSPRRIALLFGYFPQARGTAVDPPGGLVFTCLSHDIIAHETAHALLDGLHRRFREPSNPDTLAFHEAFADIVAIFQHFTYPEILRHEIGRRRGALDMAELLGGLAHQFGSARGYSKALRSAIGDKEMKHDYTNTHAPHDRGAVLVATIFRAFLAIYERRAADLMRIATGGSGVLPEGALHPDLVNRLAEEAAKIADRVLTIAIRALDYCPPVDVTFPDYLRALITADGDLVPDDPDGYRLAFLEAFEAYRIYPAGIRAISEESLRWREPLRQLLGFAEFLSGLDLGWDRRTDRQAAYRAAKENARAMHRWLGDLFARQPDLADDLGLSFEHGGRFEVHSVRPARRVAPDGTTHVDVIAVLTQSRDEPLDPDNGAMGTFRFRSGATLVLDPRDPRRPIRYAIFKRADNPRRLAAERAHRLGRNMASSHAMYFGEDAEPFAACHAGH